MNQHDLSSTPDISSFPLELIDDFASEEGITVFNETAVDIDATTNTECDAGFIGEDNDSLIKQVTVNELEQEGRNAAVSQSASKLTESTSKMKVENGISAAEPNRKLLRRVPYIIIALVIIALILTILFGSAMISAVL